VAGDPLLYLLETFRRALPTYIPEAYSALLFGGITLGEFSLPWSDVDIIIWVNTDEVTPDLAERAVHLWNHFAQEPLGHLVYLYVAPRIVIGGPMTVGGGGVPGQPRSLRVYRHKSKQMEGYPLSLPDTVSLVRHGTLLSGQEIRGELPRVPDDWPRLYLRERLDQLNRAVSDQLGPYGPHIEATVRSWGADGIMSEPLWLARHLYSLLTGEILAKEQAASWYLARGKAGALAESLRLILDWRTRGEAPEAEVLRVARLIRPATYEFLLEVVEWLGISGVSLPGELPSALKWVSDQLT
jgi:hypothetical protein